MAAARSGDRKALEALLRAHQDRLFAVCRRLTGSDADAADALQETMIGIVRGISSFDGRSSFATWSYRVAVNASLDEVRARSRRPAPGLPEGDGGTQADRADGVAQRLDLDAALLLLTPEHRAAVVLRDVCQLDYSEIAKVVGVPLGTVRSRIARGRAALVSILGGEPAVVGGSAARGTPQ